MQLPHCCPRSIPGLKTRPEMAEETFLTLYSDDITYSLPAVPSEKPRTPVFHREPKTLHDPAASNAAQQKRDRIHRGAVLETTVSGHPSNVNSDRYQQGFHPNPLLENRRTLQQHVNSRGIDGDTLPAEHVQFSDPRKHGQLTVELSLQLQQRSHHANATTALHPVLCSNHSEGDPQ